MRSPIHFSIVGCGHIAKKHIEAILALDNADLLAICDNNPDRLKEFQEQYNVKGYLSLEEMLTSEPEIDVVNICTPSGLHAKLAITAAKAKKHLIVEKPIALTLEDADSIINVCEENEVKLTVVHPNRFRPAVVELKRAVESGLFGKISHVNATVRWNRNQEYYDQAAWRGTKQFDGGVLMNQAIHNLDLLLWLMGSVEEVTAHTATRLRNIEAEDIAVATLKLTTGALGLVEATANVFPRNLEESISIFGEKGTAMVGGTTANWLKHWKFESVSEDEVAELASRIEKDPFGISGHQQIIANLMESIYTNNSPLVTGEDGKNALKLVLAIYEAAEKQQVVKWSDL